MTADQINSLLSSGQIAKALGRPPQTIRRKIRELGISPTITLVIAGKMRCARYEPSAVDIIRADLRHPNQPRQAVA